MSNKGLGDTVEAVIKEQHLEEFALKKDVVVRRESNGSMKRYHMQRLVKYWKI
jgi:hypothetical protein